MGDDGTRWQRVKDVFAEALLQPAAARETWLRTACGDDGALRDEVASLLAAHADDAFLQTPAGAAERIGAFTLVRVLGAGGMGTVWEAEQDAPRRTVALKVLRPFGAPGAARRFEHEAEILARLRHPGIAQVFAAGTTTLHGVVVPWFAMELVEHARTLSQWLEQERPDRARRLRASSRSVLPCSTATSTASCIAT